MNSYGKLDRPTRNETPCQAKLLDFQSVNGTQLSRKSFLQQQRGKAPEIL